MGPSIASTQAGPVMAAGLAGGGFGQPIGKAAAIPVRFQDSIGWGCHTGSNVERPVVMPEEEIRGRVPDSSRVSVWFPEALRHLHRPTERLC